MGWFGSAGALARTFFPVLAGQGGIHHESRATCAGGVSNLMPLEIIIIIIFSLAPATITDRSHMILKFHNSGKIEHTKQGTVVRSTLVPTSSLENSHRKIGAKALYPFRWRTPPSLPPLFPACSDRRIAGVLSEEFGSGALFAFLVVILSTTFGVLFAFRAPYLECVKITNRRKVAVASVGPSAVASK